MSAAGDLGSTVRALLAPGKGILAADESFPTIGKRFNELGIRSTADSRRAYREILFTTPGLGRSISGVILFDETIRQKASGGRSLARVIERQGMIPGIKVDEGTKDLPGYPGEKYTAGLDGLPERLAEYRRLGARFAKWRGVLEIGRGTPSEAAIQANATLHALYAALCQEAGLVPIVEPEILMDGDHTIGRCEKAATAVLRATFTQLALHRVALGGMLLKTGMVLPGTKASRQASPREIAAATLRCFRASVPKGVPGIVFLSGGQADIEATQRLNALCAHQGLPWRLTFSFGRALQDAPMRRWAGKAANAALAQAALAHRARCNGLAVGGKYSEAVETGGGAS